MVSFYNSIIFALLLIHITFTSTLPVIYDNHVVRIIKNDKQLDSRQTVGFKKSNLAPSSIDVQQLPPATKRPLTSIIPSEEFSKEELELLNFACQQQSKYDPMIEEIDSLKQVDEGQVAVKEMEESCSNEELEIYAKSDSMMTALDEYKESIYELLFGESDEDNEKVDEAKQKLKKLKII